MKIIFEKILVLNIFITIEEKLQDISEIKRNQKIIKRQLAAYNLGRYSDVANTYPINSEKRKAFDFGRLAKLTKEK